MNYTTPPLMKPLENLIVLEFCQYMAGPSAGLRLADLGARVIKIERPDAGDSGRHLAIKSLFEGEDSLLFHTINRNKESYAADLKSGEDLEKVKKLIARADVLTHNFRPGVMERLGLDYDTVKKINPRIVYGVISGYGDKGPWKGKPGQDLLVQALSGLTWLSGDRDDPPTAFGLSVADMICGSHLTQGILSALIRRGRTKGGALVEVNLLASLVDFQFEVITTFLNDGGKLPHRAARGNAHAYLSAPYGVYQTSDGYIAIAMGALGHLGETIGFSDMMAYENKEDWFTKRDEIGARLSEFLRQKSTGQWLALLEPADIWCADVLDYTRFLSHEGYRVLQMNQDIDAHNGQSITTTRCPIRIDGKKIFSTKAAPRLGQDTALINREFNLEDSAALH
jgi:crotonobetainyl-CoA:carnitine CoA-transferase CaiB-like acyl-CoA transferase